jgi:hypothetical protein
MCKYVFKNKCAFKNLHFPEATEVLKATNKLFVYGLHTHLKKVSAAHLTDPLEPFESVTI